MRKVPVYGIDDFIKEKNETSFYANDLRTHLKNHQFVNAPHRHNTYITILFTKGSGVHQIDFDSFPVKAGNVFLLSPGQVHCWKLSKDADGFVFFHTKEFYNDIFLHRKMEDFPFFYLQQNYPLIMLSSKERDKVAGHFEALLEIFNSALPARQAMLGSQTDLIYLMLSELYKTKENKKGALASSGLRIIKLQKLIDENFKSKKFPHEYADRMNISTRHLSRMSQEALGKSTSDLIADRIITEAKRLLTHSDISIAALADQLGYEDLSYFIRFFKKRTGFSPKVFQEKLKRPF
jgi:AraC family transcriptional activator of pobA